MDAWMAGWVNDKNYIIDRFLGYPVNFFMLEALRQIPRATGKESPRWILFCGMLETLGLMQIQVSGVSYHIQTER